MAHRFAEIAFTPEIRELQRRAGSRDAYARREAVPEAVNAAFGPREAAFIESRDSFYMATIGGNGWPYVQHRGGPPGFLRVLDPRRIGFADVRGNRQYISVGNVAADDRVSLFLMDYPARTRLKMFGRARLVEGDALAGWLEAGGMAVDGVVERGVEIALEGFDWNCPQHVTPRFTAAEVEAMAAPLRARIAELEAGRV
ncbi:MAG: pyridoxamine 5'-phosphate oxidase family protein [Rhodospirillales bacterium]|nr:MAG: pyridoxamine 5'-phosphate oxidase family protein [Rhodospirillales bacterium]